MDILKEIKNFLKKYKLLNKESRFLIGFSGGADSMLLLYYLGKLRKEYGFEVFALHINHGWRGEESDNEQRNCEEFCKSIGVEFYCEKLGESIKHSENDARIARYAIFDKYADLLKADVVLTAHNLDDKVETFVYRLIKGMGTVGALSIPEFREFGEGKKIYRPLINVRAFDIRKKCGELGLKYNVDSSNFDSKYKRNLIRNEIFPKFREVNPEFEGAILNFIENINSVNRISEDFYDKNCEKIVLNNKLQTPLFMSFSEDIRRVIIYKYLKRNDIEPEKKLILSLLDNIKENSDKPNGKKYSIKRAKDEDLTFFCSKKECYILPQKKGKKSLNKEFKKNLTSPFSVKKYENEKIPKSTDLKAVVNSTALDLPLVLRNRRPGDIFQPFSHKSSVKLKDFLIEKQIPEHKRDELPLLCKGKEVLWVIGVEKSEKLRADLKTPESCVIIEYNK